MAVARAKGKLRGKQPKLSEKQRREPAVSTSPANIPLATWRKSLLSVARRFTKRSAEIMASEVPSIREEVGQLVATLRLPFHAEIHHAVWRHVFVRLALALGLHPDAMHVIELSRMACGVGRGLSEVAGHLNEQVVCFALITPVVMSVRWHFGFSQPMHLCPAFRAQLVVIVRTEQEASRASMVDLPIIRTLVSLEGDHGSKWN